MSIIQIKRHRWKRQLFTWINKVKLTKEKKAQKMWTTLSYTEDFVILTSAISGCISTSSSASLCGIPIGITMSAIWFKISAIFARIKKHQSIIKRKKKK